MARISSILKYCKFSYKRSFSTRIIMFYTENFGLCKLFKVFVNQPRQLTI